MDPLVYRPDFPILARKVHGDVPLVYLDNAATTQRPRQVIAAITEAYEQHYANVGRGVHSLAEEADLLYEGAREKVRALVGAAPSRDRETATEPSTREVIFTSGATAGINLVARSWGESRVGRGDEIIVTEMEHHANLIPWHQLAERTGAAVRYVPITDEGLLDLEALDGLLNERTRLVAVTAVSNVLGTVNPVAEIVRRAHAAGAMVLVDGAQSVPHQAIDVARLDADFLVFSGHKMLGPSGIGVLWARERLLEEMPPFLGGGGMVKDAWIDHFEPERPPRRFEAGTPPIVPAIGLGAAIDYLAGVGLEAICRHERRLVERAHELLAQIPGVQILGPDPAHKAGVVSFVVNQGRIHPHEVAQFLDRRGIAIRAGHHCARPLQKRLAINASSRASFYLYNTLEEVERFGEAVAEVVRFFSRPAAPRRRRAPAGVESEKSGG
jgi:cysteine desulfurase/selenocysteine lyase